jgi:hypothetical protein
VKTLLAVQLAFWHVKVNAHEACRQKSKARQHILGELKMPDICNFSTLGVDFTVGEVVANETWNLHSSMNKDERISGRERTVLELFLKRNINNPDKPSVLDTLGIKGYSAYTIDDIIAYVKATENIAQVTGAPTYISRLRSAILKAAGKDIEQISKKESKDLYSKFLPMENHLGLNYYVWKPEIYSLEDYISIDYREKAVLYIKAKDDGEKETGYIINRLIKTYSELESFFYKFSDDIHLPFFEMSPDKFGRPSFPLDIKDDETTIPIRGESSLKKIRRAEKIHKNWPIYFFSGEKYRLLQAKPGNWVIGRTIYDNLIESCDYLSFWIKAGWQDVFVKKKNEDEFFKNDEVVKEWHARIKNIMEGDFTHYLAGLAFSVPIFQVTDHGIMPLMAKGSNIKQTDYGLHVAPAGMLEFSILDIEKKLSLENFLTIVAKEMVEEVFVGKNLSEVANNYKRLFSVMESTPFLACAPFSTRVVRLIFDDILIHWKNIWKNKDKLPSDILLKKVLSFDPSKDPSFWIVDGLILRPEIIMPIYIKEDLPKALNWEYATGKRQEEWFPNMDKVREYINESRNFWTAPGLAALYFGAKHYFEAKDKKALITE